MKKDVFDGHLEMLDSEVERVSELLADTDPVSEPDQYAALLEYYCKLQDMVNQTRSNYEAFERLAQEDRKTAVSRANKRDDLTIEQTRTVGSVAAAIFGGAVSLFGLNRVIKAENDPDEPTIIRPSLRGWIPSNPFKR